MDARRELFSEAKTYEIYLSGGSMRAASDVATLARVAASLMRAMAISSELTYFDSSDSGAANERIRDRRSGCGGWINKAAAVARRGASKRRKPRRQRSRRGCGSRQ